MEYTEYEIKFRCTHFNRKWNFAQRFLNFILFVRMEVGEH